MKKTSGEILEYLSNVLTKSDIYSAKAIAKISSVIINARKSKNMTQKQFAEFMGVTQGMVSKWESADYNFTIENIAQICAKLDLALNIEIQPENEILLLNRSRSRSSLERWGLKPRGGQDNLVA